jgi:hypothetical protein
LGKMVMFFSVVWLIVSLAGGVLEGNVTPATTVLTSGISATATTIPVRSTLGFPNTGIIVIGSERIAYSDKTTTTFIGTLFSPVVRGAQETAEQSHIINDKVRTVESSMMNQSAQYNVSLINDATGPAAFVTVPLGVFRLLGSYLHPPFQFMGTDLQMLVYFWWAMLAGMIITIGISLAGARRV